MFDTVKLYVPSAARVADAICGFCCNEENPSGPDHVQAVALPPVSVKLIGSPTQAGESLPVVIFGRARTVSV